MSEHICQPESSTHVWRVGDCRFVHEGDLCQCRGVTFWRFEKVRTSSWLQAIAPLDRERSDA